VPRGTSARSLTTGLLIGLFGTVGVALVAYGWFNLSATQERLTALMRADAEQYGVLLRQATHDAMLLNRKREVQDTFERIGQGTTLLRAVRLYDPEGRVALSSQPAEIGTRFAIDAAPCAACHAPSGGAVPTAAFLSPRPTALGAGVFRHLAVVGNETACAAAGCHPSPRDRSVLGVLDVEMSSAPLADALATAKTRALGSMVVVFLATGMLAAGFVRRYVRQPVLALRAGTERIARGDLDTRIAVEGRHELAELAQAFNKMAEDLATARHELTAWSHTLEEKVVEKTQELQRTQRWALHTEKMASLGRLSATVAHELNNPLSGILTFARLVERQLARQPAGEALAPAVRDELIAHLQLMQQECARCGNIVRNLLLFAKPSQQAARGPVEVADLVERAVAVTRHHLEMSRIELRWERPGGSLQLGVDGEQLVQALVALIVNAVEAITSAGGHGGEIGIRLAAEGDDIVLAITDSGPGIPAEVLPHIFEPFFSTKDRESGVGLGLTVVYGIVTSHGGSIETSSVLGQGSTFEMRFPRSGTTADAGGRAGDAPASPPPRPLPGPHPSDRHAAPA
jgi:two-component system NtrC family sensor kinase